MTAQDDLIRGKVARILNSRELAINVGAQAGVRINMKFDVLDPKGDDIKDPDTGEILGSLNRPKLRVQVTRVEEKLAVASTYRSKTVNVGGVGFMLPSFADALRPPRYVTKFESLKTEEATWEDIDEAESFVKTGDPVIEVIEDTKEEIANGSD